MSNTVELKAVQAGVRANFTYIQDAPGNVGFTEIQLTITDQAEGGHVSGDLSQNTTSGHGAMTKTIYVDAASTSAFAILESGVSPDFFDFVAGGVYNVVAKFGVLSQVSEYTHTLPPVSADYTTVISHGSESINIDLTAENNNSANITHYLVTVMGNNKEGNSATYQKRFEATNGNIDETVYGTGSEFGLAGFVGQFPNGEVLEIVIAAQNDAGYEFESKSYHVSPTDSANEPTLTITSGVNIDNNVTESDEDLFVKINPGVQIGGDPDLFYIIAIDKQVDGSQLLYKKVLAQLVDQNGNETQAGGALVMTGELLSTGTSGWTVQTSGVPANGETETLLSLVDGTLYTFECWAKNQEGLSANISSPNTGTPSGLPAQPNVVYQVGESIGSGKIRVIINEDPTDVNVNNGSTILQYNILRDANDNLIPFNNWTQINDVNDAYNEKYYYELDSLANGTPFTMTVVAQNSNGNSDSTIGVDVTPRTNPDAPTFAVGNDAPHPVAGNASTLPSQQVQGTVDKLASITAAGGDSVANIKYVFELSNDTNFDQNSTIIVSDNDADINTHIFNGLVDGTMYYMRVKTMNSFGEVSAYTNLGSGDPFVYVQLQPNADPYAPTFNAGETVPGINTQSGALGSQKVKGTVDALDTTAEGGGSATSDLMYTFEICESPDFDTNVTSNQGNAGVVVHVFENLTNGTLYYIRARVTNTFGRNSLYTRYNDANGNAIALQPNTIPDVPTFNAGETVPDINNVSTIGSQEVKGTVNALANTAAGGGSATGDIRYTFEICEASGFDNNNIITLTTNQPDEVTKTFENLTNGTSYYMRAKATNQFVDANGNRSESNTVNYVDENGNMLALVPSTAPTINTTNLNTILLASVKNTFIDSANNEFFTVNMTNIGNFVNNGGYPMTEIVVTATGNDTQSVTIALADIAGDKAFDGANQLSLPATNNGGANNAGFLYTLSVSANNAVYTTGNAASSSTSTVHMTNTKLIASGVSASLGGANGDAITFSWSVQDFASLNEFTNGTGSRFELQLQEKIPTETIDGNNNSVIAYPAAFSNVGAVVEKDIDGTVHANGLSSYSHEFTGLRYGTIYSVAITTNSELYDVNPAVSYSEGPVNDASDVVPHTKPTIEVASDGNGGNGKIVSISSNGSALETTFALDSSATNSGITDLTTTIVNSVTEYAGGNPPFTLYNDVNGNEASLKSTAAYTPTGGANFLIVTENDAGASISLNGNPLGLSSN